MKKFLLSASLVLFVIVTKAQEQPAPKESYGQPPKPPSIEDRLKRTNDVIQQEVQLSDAQKKAVEQAFKKFFTEADKVRKDNPPPPPPPPDPKVKEAMDKLVKERDETIKKALTADQYKKYEEAAKKLHPPKPGDKKEPPPPPPTKE